MIIGTKTKESDRLFQLQNALDYFCASSSSCDVTSVVVDSHEAMTNGASLNETVLSPGTASGVQDVSMEDVAIAEEAVEQDDDDDDVVDDDDEAQK